MSSGGKHKVSNVFRFGKMYSKKSILGISVVLAFYTLYMFVSESTTNLSMHTKVQYVDSKTGEVLPDFEFPGGLDFEDGGNEIENQKIMSQVETSQVETSQVETSQVGTSQVGTSQEPHALDEKKAGIQQNQHGTDKKIEIKSGDCVIPERRAKATFVSLARNSEIWELLTAIRNVEDRFNRKFHYDWVFLNDEPFTDEFKNATRAIVSGTAKYGLIPKEHWSIPSWIDQEKAKKSRTDLAEAGIIYGGSESYRHMCRYESGFFYRHELMKEYDWYWRVEPGIKIHCDLDYDLFTYMEDHDKVYGFTISLYEFVETIPTLWNNTREFLKLHPEYLAKDSFMDFISDDKGVTYNNCHFWTNFEVASLKFWRSQAYMDYFEYLDQSGGFFYERWGDAPVHSIAASLFLPKSKIHYFDDVGYTHGIHTQCPLNNEFRFEHKCDCSPESDFTFRGDSCGKKYFDIQGLERPREWVDHQ